MTLEEATARLEKLEACAAEGQRRYSESLAATRAAQQTGAEVAGPLAAYHAEVLHRQRDADADEARRLTLEVLLRITDDGLLLEPVDPTVPARGLRVVDPGPARALEAASSAADAARVERDTFKAEVQDLLEEADARKRMGRVRDALDGESPAELREAIAELGAQASQPRRPVLTTADLPAGGPSDELCRLRRKEAARSASATPSRPAGRHRAPHLGSRPGRGRGDRFPDRRCRLSRPRAGDPRDGRSGGNWLMGLGAKVIEVAAEGPPGSAFGEARAWLTRGALRAVDVDFASGQPASADVTITSGGRGLLTLANQSSDRTLYPRVPAHDASGTEIAGEFDRPLLRDGELVVSVAQANADDPAATVRLYVDH